MDNVSQDEIDDLVDAINDSHKPKLYRKAWRKPSAAAEPGKTNALTKEEISQMLEALRGKSKLVDVLTLIHEELAPKLSCFFSAYLKNKVVLHVNTVYDELTFNEYIHMRGMPTPTHLSIVSLPPLKERAVIEVTSSAYSSILDVIFRGSGNNRKYKSELTNLEKFVIEKLVAHSFRAICGSWKKAIEFYPQLTVTETCPQEAVKISPPDEAMIVVLYDCKINDVTGSIRIYYPYRLGTIIARLGSKQ